MNSLRRWLYRPKRSDRSLLAQFYFADEELNLIAAELDGFEGRKDPERCAALVNQLRACQARVLNIVSQIMDESIKDQRALRDFRVKFPDDVIQENLAGQLWFGAECLAAGSSIMNREVESACMRPLARALTKNLDSLRTILREQCLHNVDEYTDLIKENLIIFDKLFAEFELSYVSAMVSVKTAHEYDMIQEITVLFSETVQRALQIGLLTQEMIDEYDPALMFTIPRLAIVSGVLIFKDGPLNPDNDPWNISEMFRPFQTLLLKIRELLSILTSAELNTLERALCSQDEPSFLLSLEEKRKQAREERRKYKKERKMNGKINQDPSDGDNGSIESELTAREIAERLEALALNFEATHNENRDNVNNSASQTVSSGGPDQDDLQSLSLIHNSDIVTDPHDSVTSHQTVSDGGGVRDLFREVSLDTSEIVSVPESASTRHDLLVQGIQLPAQFRVGNIDDETRVDSCDLPSLTCPDIDNEESSFAQMEILNHEEVLNSGDRFSLNKCDSKDSGLQSEVVSNSGSMFTISSSDSNQQILSSDSMPTPSDQNCTDSSEDADSNDMLTEENTSCSAQLENSSDSSATIVGVNQIASLENQGTPNESTSEEIFVDPDITQILPNNTVFEVAQPSTDSTVLCEVSNPEPTDLHISCQNDQTVVSNANGGSVDVESVSDSVQSVSDEAPDCSAKPVHENSHHSHDAFCVATKRNSEAIAKNIPNSDVNGDSDLISCNDFQNVESHSNFQINTSGIVNEASVVIDSVTIDGQEENREQNNNISDSAAESLCSRPTSVLAQPSQTSNLSLQSSSNDNAANVARDSRDNEIKTDLDCSSSTQLKDEPQSSEPNPIGGDGTQSSATNQVNRVKNDNKRINTNLKIKITSKKNARNRGRKPGRSESGPSRSRESKPMLCPHHARMILESHQQLDSDRYNSSDTSSYTSECGDQEEIALAIEAAESATRNQVRARFRSSSDMIHRLFVCISGVADQLQTNFAGDLRNILRCVFDMNCPEPMDTCENEKSKDTTPLGAAYRAMSHASRTPRHRHSSLRRDPPAWLPDEQSNECMACQVPFNFLRRRHHCRNCGKIFCGRCSSNFVPLPHFGQDKAVRVCNRCFMFQVTPFTTE